MKKILCNIVIGIVAVFTFIAVGIAIIGTGIIETLLKTREGAEECSIQ